VASGLGTGLSVAVPNQSISSKVRVVPLAGFPSILIGALWRGKTTPLLEVFLDELQVRAKQMAKP
ncbi:MAG TPA: hypothetical protein VFW05_03930, partial [Verrucomicrobiae bacterium]|nr:hypothetical protein [Verrucomicrobiae bacterium]